MSSGEAKRDPAAPEPEAPEKAGSDGARAAKGAAEDPKPDWYHPPGESSKDDETADGKGSADSQVVVAPEVVDLKPRQRSGRGQVVAVVSGKPGTGKSTIAANIACAIARDHRMTVAVVDLSLQFGDQALMFDAGYSPSMVDVLANIDALTPDFLLECMHQAHGLRILSAPPSPELADLVDANHIDLIVGQLRLLFDFIVIDTSSHLSDISLQAIDNADSLLVVTTPYLASVKDTKLLLKTMSDLGVPAAKLTAVLNRMEPAIKMGLEVLEANLKFPIGAELPHTSQAAGRLSHRRRAAGALEGEFGVGPADIGAGQLDGCRHPRRRGTEAEARVPARQEMKAAPSRRRRPGLSDPIKTDLSHAELLRIYRLMRLGRAFDERMWLLNRSGKVAFVMPHQGHEGAQAGAGMAVKPGVDWVVPYYRDITLSLVMGMTLEELMMGFFSKAADPSTGGRLMLGHYGKASLQYVTGSSCVASQILHAVGIGLALKIEGREAACLTCFGEGATAEGDFHEAMSFAGIHQLPVVFFCQNNGYSITVPTDEEIPVGVAERARGYGFPGERVDGNDPVAVYDATRRAMERARAGQGPSLVEAIVYRLTPHSSDDDDKRYRTSEEVETHRVSEPVSAFRARLMKAGILTEADDDAITAEIAAAVDAAQAAAEAAPDPDPRTSPPTFSRPIAPTRPIVAPMSPPPRDASSTCSRPSAKPWPTRWSATHGSS